MMQLELRQGSHVQSAQGKDLGTVREFVVKPSTREFTHVLVEKGVFFTDDRVIPVETIDHVEDDRIILGEEVDPDTLPRFVREHYTPIDEETRGRLGVPTGYMWRYPTSHTGPFPIYPSYPIAPAIGTRPTVEESPIREELAQNEVIDSKTPVISTNGEKVGSVSEVQVGDDGQLSHLVVDLGFLSDEKVLPAHWVEEIESDGIRLAVSNTAVESLETIT
jgi:uncharacterized protein YrrD